MKTMKIISLLTDAVNLLTEVRDVIRFTREESFPAVVDLSASESLALSGACTIVRGLWRDALPDSVKERASGEEREQISNLYKHHYNIDDLSVEEYGEMSRPFDMEAFSTVACEIHSTIYRIYNEAQAYTS